MSFFNDTNHKRVEKMQETLALIRKSGDSNKVDREAMWSMLEPVINQIGDMIGEEPQKPEPTEQPAPTVERTHKTQPLPMWVTIRQMAEEAPLKELTQAMAIFINRFEEHMDD